MKGQQPSKAAMEAKDEELAMKLQLMQVEEGFPGAASADADGGSPTGVASLPSATSGALEEPMKVIFRHEDRDVAEKLQKEYLKEAYEKELQQNQKQQEENQNKNQQSSSENSEEDVPITELRMGAAPYETTVASSRQLEAFSGNRRVKDRLGSRHHAQARQRSTMQQNQTVLMELPPDLNGHHNHAVAAGSLAVTNIMTTTPESSVTHPSSSGNSKDNSSNDNANTSLEYLSRHETTKPFWFDISRPSDGDDVFLHLLGNYPDDNHDQSDKKKCTLDIKIPKDQLGRLSNDPTKLGEVAGGACLKEIFENEIYKTEENSAPLSLQEVIGKCEILDISIREAALRLPFAVRFQLERSILWDSEADPLIRVRRKYSLPYLAACERKKAELIGMGRKLLLVVLQDVLPVLLEICCEMESLTLQELFAEELWESLRLVKRAIVQGKPLKFYNDEEERVLSFFECVKLARNRAMSTLKGAKELCGCTESDLSDEAMNRVKDDPEQFLQFIRKRSLWPVAEYRATFTQDDRPDGRLLPKGLTVNNKIACRKALGKKWNMGMALKYSSPESRRAIREFGWSVRDRFLVFSDVPFHDIFQQNLIEWCRASPLVCGRRFDFLFDKGTGKPNLWFYSSTANVPRDNFLKQLGCFDHVHPSKLGDRISLAFTLTKPLICLKKSQIMPIPEVVKNGYKFSDGCGVMGWDIARRISEIDSRNQNQIAGSIQIRIGGIKGMLTVKKDFPSDKIGIRPSMLKYPSCHTTLEVKTAAKMKKGGDTLPDSDKNKGGERQLFDTALLLLHHGKVPSQAFLDLQRKAWAEIIVKYDSGAESLLQQPINFDKVSKYIHSFLKDGRKADENKTLFSIEELENITNKMENGKKGKVKMTLSCSMTLMMGVLDEHDILQEGEILVGNGYKIGKVLICRPPCVHPGDIQVANAVKPPDNVGLKPILRALSESVVFSTKGSRPLADMLAGGDLDGDQYYIIDEDELVNSFQSSEACDFGSQSNGYEAVVSHASIFRTSSDRAPHIDDQLAILQQYMDHGELVATSSEAWFRLADRYGPDDERSKIVARVCQKALDSRKTDCVFTSHELAIIDTVLSPHHPDRIATPRWRGGDAETPCNSILGNLYLKWDEKTNNIRTLREQRKQRLPSEQSEPSVLGDDWSIVNSGDSVVTADTRAFDIIAGIPALSSKTANQMLADVTFGREDPLFTRITRIDFRTVDDDDRKALVNMVLHEYKTSLQQGIEEARDIIGSKDPPREFDVYLIRRGWGQEQLAICMPKARADGDVEWLVSDGKLEINDVTFWSKVASLTSFSRIIEALVSNPVPRLMRQAMQRENLIDAVHLKNAPAHPILDTLTESQKVAVATVATFKSSGFLLVKGPPGTGKTHTIIGMVRCVGRALVVAPSNAAVANVALKLIKHDGYSVHNVIVWGENCDASVKFLNPSRRHEKYIGFLRRYSKEDNENEKEGILQEFASNTLHLPNAGLEEVESLCADPSGSHHLKSAKVLLCTLNTTGSRSLKTAMKSLKQKFELAILDEASQCPEAEFYLLTAFPGIQRIVLVGDPKQLPATVLNPACAEAGFGLSFLSHVYRYCRDKVHLLDVQFRADPDLARISNTLFYDGQLKDAPSVKNREPQVKHPFRFVSTSLDGYGTEERKGSSWFNEYEAGVIRSIIRKDEDIADILNNVNSTVRIMIITPYREQVRRLQTVLRKINHRSLCSIATVDAYQGQEAEIVILSTVRTNSAGFVDNANRLCVALTRAQRVLRVVGDLQFFKSIPSDYSVLRELANYAEQNDLVADTNIDTAAWRQPKWQPGDTSWKPMMVARFHHCLKLMNRRERNIAFNTLLAVATPRIKSLKSRPLESKSGQWQVSALSSSDVYIVWLAKHIENSGNHTFVGIIEAHYAANNRGKCNTFVQNHKVLPAYAATGVKADLSDTLSPAVGLEDAVAHTADFSFERWAVTPDMQGAIIDGSIEELPTGRMALDDQQERILYLPPPLLIESRSGTGKTNVLFAHAVSYARELVVEEEQDEEGTKQGTSRFSILFVTVSPKLQEELRNRYAQVCRSAAIPLPPIVFFSFKEFLQFLVEQYSVPVGKVSTACTFLQYTFARQSHQKLGIESSLVENEIGGVIQGSLAAAIHKRPLKEDEYLNEIRSNIPNETDAGRSKRQRVFAEYQRYKDWKNENGVFDLGDIVLKLLNLNITKQQIFKSAYLDEVQDFSYAAIYLICSLAGKENVQWVAAGDTAQMISPGCSFKFDGLKQTLLRIQPSMELRKVEQLKRNYRMSKGILDVSNSLLKVFKTNFPGQVEYTQPEIAVKDLGTKVSLVKWNDALKIQASLGTKQAIVFADSGSDTNALAEQLASWSRNHPLILSVLDSKGLEYNDVIVVFNKMGGSAWTMSSEAVDSLRNLRELYVAITRAKRRVVILVRKKFNPMKDFFENYLGLAWQEANIVMREFNEKTSPDEWFKEGQKYFREERFNLAESCFNAANNNAWSAYSSARLFLIQGQKAEAKAAYRTCTRAFFESAEYERCLDALQDLANLEPWEEQDDKILDEALKECPAHLPRKWILQFSIVNRNSWEPVTVQDLGNQELVPTFRKYRTEPRLQRIIDTCSDHERTVVSSTMPEIVGDFYLRNKHYQKALSLFVSARDDDALFLATDGAIADAKKGVVDIVDVITSWENYEPIKELPRRISDLLALFRDPMEAARTISDRVVSNFGKRIIRTAVMQADLHPTVLHDFDKDLFHDVVHGSLVERYRDEPIRVLEWYQDHDDNKHALSFAEKNLAKWSDDHLVAKIVGQYSLRPKGLTEQIKRRGIYTNVIAILLQKRDFDLAEQISNQALADDGAANKIQHAKALLSIWRPLLDDPTVQQKSKKTAGNSKLALLLSLFIDPEALASSPGKGNVCMKAFGADIVKEACARFTDDKKRYAVLKRFDNKAFELERPKQTSKPKQQASISRQEAGPFQVGQRVRIAGLTTKKGQDFNGRCGNIDAPLRPDGRYAVRVDGEKHAVSLLPEKLTAIDDESDDDDDDDDNDDGDDAGNEKQKAVPAKAKTTKTAETKSEKAKTARRQGSQEKSDSEDMPGLLGRNDEVSADASDSSEGGPPGLQKSKFNNNSDDSEGDSNGESSDADSADSSEAGSEPPPLLDTANQESDSDDNVLDASEQDDELPSLDSDDIEDDSEDEDGPPNLSARPLTQRDDSESDGVGGSDSDSSGGSDENSGEDIPNLHYRARNNHSSSDEASEEERDQRRDRRYNRPAAAQQQQDRGGANSRGQRRNRRKGGKKRR